MVSDKIQKSGLGWEVSAGGVMTVIVEAGRMLKLSSHSSLYRNQKMSTQQPKLVCIKPWFVQYCRTRILSAKNSEPLVGLRRMFPGRIFWDAQNYELYQFHKKPIFSTHSKIRTTIFGVLWWSVATESSPRTTRRKQTGEIINPYNRWVTRINEIGQRSR